MNDQPARLERTRQPILNLPAMVQVLLAINVAVHVIRYALSPRTDEMVVAFLGFIPARFTEAFDWTAPASLITYQFLHGDFVHLGINMAFMMAVGTACERRLGPWRLLIFALACGVAGAAAHFTLNPHDWAVLIGFSGATSGLLAGTMLLLTDPIGLRITRRFVSFSAVWIAINVASGVSGWPYDVDVQIAWVAHIGGYVCGFVLMRLLDPRRAERRF